MKTTKAFVSRFYAPVAASLVLLTLAIFTPKVLSPSGGQAVEAEIKLAFIGIKVPLSTLEADFYLIKIVLLTLGLLAFLYAINIDFSKYFPRRLKLDAYFDPKGIARTLATFRPEDLVRMNIESNWLNHLADYDSDVVSSLKRVWNALGHTDPWPDPKEESPREYFHCSGETTFVVQRKGLLTYKVVEAEGQLLYSADYPRRERKDFGGVFSLRDTSASYIRPNLIDLIKSPTVLIAPEFMQVFRVDSWRNEGPFDHILIAATRIALFPLPSFGDSIYLWKGPTGRWIPIAYCIYHANDALYLVSSKRRQLSLIWRSS
ncbi:hypothetical protein [Ideonella sp. A 288]|uniref:hypothetical protein n=1 Tax=Ideonella sp. A 288 TaxID=1962181 RepID=UPI001184F715|nr:hypothetical protein [Ideonella sp. A 288]